jgi:NAD-dependent deacetylase
MADTKQIAEWIMAAESVVAFTGAGISTESGIPDFRSPGGVWATNQPVYYDQFLASEEARYEYWRQKAIAHQDFKHSQPNAGHQVLANWEQQGHLTAVVTQNIDGLHQIAGSCDVVELHGTAREIACLQCGARYDAEEMVAKFLEQDAVPVCPACPDGLLKHATVSFGQSLDMTVLNRAATLSRRAGVYLAMGSSLVVEPAASLPRLAHQHGAHLVIINRDPTPLDGLAEAVIHHSIGETLTDIDRHMPSSRAV